MAKVIDVSSIPEGRRVVHKGLYCFLALFFGGLGIHKFYAGYAGWGILYAGFCWTFIPLILAIIDILFALFKRADANGRIIV